MNAVLICDEFIVVVEDVDQEEEVVGGAEVAVV
jgi:hypothetical protein